MAYGVTVTGNPDDGFTSAEIEIDGDYLGRVFELTDGWYVNLAEPERLRDAECVAAVLAAKAALLPYVNRRGFEVPEGMTRGAVSLLLMQREDGKGFTLPAVEPPAAG